ncbi:UNKNOWN [Stylonychia lemnae]|uniref:Chorein N-terminal domain-containing protein n=1 Tax=Stylonychia lemnae TaxID=5949 RepID=A0A078AKK0_STYLE|nr:UNKNOWN [Stylonychia lemnae]|eukprot:CDW82744.1 UNKNOWN [Stylonychia lemnae]
MFTNKIYDCLKIYLDRYLFGFDKNQLNMSIIKGNINLKSVNIRPDEANRIIDGLMLPFSILNVWNNPLELAIDDLYLILGPNMSFLSHNESYIGDEGLDDSYDSTNVFNIFEHDLQIKNKVKNIDKIEPKKEQNSENNDDDSLKSNSHNLMKNLRLTIKRLHIRFEDDYFSAQSPYSFGVVIDQVDLRTSDTEWSFDSLLHLNFFRVNPQHKEEDNKGQGFMILKELNLTNANLYVNTMSEMFIPSSLWEQTRHLENQIFDAMPVESLNDLMNDFLKMGSAPQQSKPFAQAKFTFLFTPFKVNLTPGIIDDLARFYEFIQNFSISLDLKQYRPQRKPICLSDLNGQDIQDDHIKRKRKLIVRDWFFFAVWYIRLRNLLVNFYSEQLIEKELEQNQEQYENLIKAAQSGKSNMKQFMDDASKKNNTQQSKDKTENLRNYDEILQLYKFQGITLNIYENLDKYSCKNKQSLPSFEIDLDSLVYASDFNFINSTTRKQLVFKDMKVFHSQLFKRDQQFNQNLGLQQKQSLSLQNNINQVPTDQMKSLTFRDNGQKGTPGLNRGPSNQSYQQIQNPTISGMGAQVSTSAQGIKYGVSSSYQQPFNNSNQTQFSKLYIGGGIPNNKYSNYYQAQNHNININNGQMGYSHGNNYTQRNLSQQNSSQVVNSSTNSQMENQRNTRNSKPSQIQQNQQTSILDNIFGLKQTFESFFANFTGSNDNNQASNNKDQNSSQIQIQNTFDNSNSQINMKHVQSPLNNQFESKNMQGNNSRLNNTQNIIDNSYQYSQNNNSYGQNVSTPYRPAGLRGAYYNNISSTTQRKNQNDLSDILGVGQGINNQIQFNRRGPSQQSNTTTTKVSVYQASSQQVPLINHQSQWQIETFESAKQQNCVVQRIQVLHLCSSNNLQAAFSIDQNLAMIPQKTSSIIRPKSIQIDVNVAQLDLQYCNDIIKNMCDTLVAYKKLHVFRYIPLKNLFQRRENIQRKIQLHIPFYLIKQVFASKSTQARSSILREKPKDNQFEETQKLKMNKNMSQFQMQNKRGSNRGVGNDSSEDENISDQEDVDYKTTKKYIQQAVSNKKDYFQANKNFQSTQDLKDQQLKSQAEKTFGFQSFHEDFIVKKAVEYEKTYTRVDIQVSVNVNSIQITVIQPRANVNEQQRALCKLSINQNQISLYKNNQESGFDAFGMQFQTLNKFEMYYLFVKNLRRGLDIYLQNPVFYSSEVNNFDQLRQVFRKVFRPKVAIAGNGGNNFNDVRNTIKEYLAPKDKVYGNNQSELYSKISPKNLIYNANAVQEQEMLFNKGKTKTQNKKNVSKYDALFNNLDNGKEDLDLDQISQSHTPELSYKNLNLNDNNKNDYKSLKDQKSQQQQKQLSKEYNLNDQKQRENNYENNGTDFQVYYTEEMEQDEAKEIQKMINGSSDTPLISGKKKQNQSSNQVQSQLDHQSTSISQPQQVNPQSFLAQMRKKQNTDLPTARGLPVPIKPPNNQKTPSNGFTPNVFQNNAKMLGGGITTSKNETGKNSHNTSKNQLLNRGKSQQSEDIFNSNFAQQQLQQHQNDKKQQPSVKQFSSNIDHSTKAGKQISKQQKSNKGSSCEEDMAFEERNDELGFAVMLNKQMNTAALKKTKSQNQAEPSLTSHTQTNYTQQYQINQRMNQMAYGFKNNKF